jgi:putative transposase
MSRPPRLTGFSYIGRYRYSLTFCSFARRQTFLDSELTESVIAEIQRTARERSFVILAYCAMPDHVHLLLEGTSNAADLCRFARDAKRRTGEAYSRQSKRRLWQEGFYDRVLRAEDDAKTIASYIVANPVRAGLVATATEYPHTGSQVWKLEELIESVR